MSNYLENFAEENEALQRALRTCNYGELGYSSKDQFCKDMEGAYISGIPVMDEDDFEESIKNVLEETDSRYHNLSADCTRLKEISWEMQGDSAQVLVEDLCDCFYPIFKENQDGIIYCTGFALNLDTEEIVSIEKLTDLLQNSMISVEYFVDSEKYGFSNEYGTYEEEAPKKETSKVSSNLDLRKSIDKLLEESNEMILEQETTEREYSL